VPRAAQFLFTVLTSAREGTARCTVRASFMEIYNETVLDLLGNTAAKLDVHQRPSPEQGFYVPGLSQVECSGPAALLQVLRQGIQARHTAGHALSRESSRAHAIFTVEMPAKSSGRPGGRLVFADLAGSERIKKSAGAQQMETAHINKSLLMLSNCVSALTNSPNGGCPTSATSSTFRNSKLTKVLMESLCGTGYTLVLAAVSPAQRHFDETANTLFFAAKCANITRRVEPKLQPHQREVRDLQDTVDALRAELTEAHRAAAAATDSGTEVALSARAEIHRQQAEMECLRHELVEERKQAAEMQRELDALRTTTSRRSSSKPKSRCSSTSMPPHSSRGGTRTSKAFGNELNPRQ